MHGLLFLLAPALLVMGITALVACRRPQPGETMMVAAGLAVVTALVVVAVAVGEDEDPSFEGQSRWSYHAASHDSLILLIALMAAVVLAAWLSRAVPLLRWVVPSALLLAAPTCFWAFVSLSH